MAVRTLVQGNPDLSGFLDKGSLILVVLFLQHHFLEELERTVALLAFEDSANSPVSDLLDISQRQKTASELNAAILTSQSHEKGMQSQFSYANRLSFECSSSFWFLKRSVDLGRFRCIKLPISSDMSAHFIRSIILLASLTLVISASLERSSSFQCRY